MKEYLGGVTDFLAAKKIACFREYEQLHKSAASVSVEEVKVEKESKLAFEERKQLNREIKKAGQLVEKIEQKIAQLEESIANMEDKLAAGNVSDELLKEYAESQKQLENAMDEWTSATEEVERLKGECND